MASLSDWYYQQTLAQQQASSFNQLFGNQLGQLMGTAGSGLQAIAPTHFGQVRQMRKQFKQLSKEDFRKLSKEQYVKDILSGSHKLTAEEISSRIKENLENEGIL